MCIVAIIVTNLTKHYSFLKVEEKEEGQINWRKEARAQQQQAGQRKSNTRASAGGVCQRKDDDSYNLWTI